MAPLHSLKFLGILDDNKWHGNDRGRKVREITDYNFCKISSNFRSIPNSESNKHKDLGSALQYQSHSLK